MLNSRNNLDPKIAFIMQFHSKNLAKIKRNIGASFLSYVDYRGKYSLRVIKDGKESKFDLVGTPMDVDVENYKNLETSLKEYYNEKG